MKPHLIAIATTLCTVSHVASAQYFGNYPCTSDCSGHQAGYEWAEENDVTDPYDCGGNSQSFIEGCEEYAEEQQEKQEQESEEDEDEDY